MRLSYLNIQCHSWSNAILHLLHEGLNMSLIYDVTIPFQHLQLQCKILLFQKLGTNLFFRNDPLVCKGKRINPNKDAQTCFILSWAFVPDFYCVWETAMCYRNQNGVELQKLLTLQWNVFNLGVKYLFSLRKKFYFCIDDF